MDGDNLRKIYNNKTTLFVEIFLTTKIKFKKHTQNYVGNHSEIN